VRSRGWVLVDQELEEGLRSIAAPIHDVAGQVVAAANLSLPASRASVEVIEADFLPQLLRTTALIEADLRDLHRGRPAP
jgi:IclR family transcriptional regulator, pca regulon regulatory protein